jgi:DNA-binding Lrp family transcriptional regulator
VHFIEGEMILKEIERKMLSELIRNSRRSDRELAKAIGTSQPTATRVRTKLEKEGYIKEYTAIPNFSKIGYTILALNFIKLDLKLTRTREELEAFRKTHYDAMNETPNAIMLIKRGMGLGYSAVVVSLHQSYAACDQFRDTLKDSMSANITGMDTFLVNLEEERSTMPFSFGMLANHILFLKAKEEE